MNDREIWCEKRPCARKLRHSSSKSKKNCRKSAQMSAQMRSAPLYDESELTPVSEDYCHFVTESRAFVGRTNRSSFTPSSSSLSSEADWKGAD